jgi:hypothetical protein
MWTAVWKTSNVLLVPSGIHIEQTCNSLCPPSAVTTMNAPEAAYAPTSTNSLVASPLFLLVLARVQGHLVH